MVAFLWGMTKTEKFQHLACIKTKGDGKTVPEKNILLHCEAN